MMNTSRLIISIISISLSVLMLSCRDDQAIVEEYFYIDDANSSWLLPEIDDDVFTIIDTNHISQSFVLESESSYMTQSWSSFLGVNYHMSWTEYRYRAYSSTFGDRFSFSLSSSWEPFGDHMYIELNDIGFEYDIQYDLVTRISSDSREYLSLGYCEDGYCNNDEILSTAEILSELQLGDKTYNDVLKFSYNDFEDTWGDKTIRELYLAKETGLLMYKLNGGLVYMRD